MKLLMSTLQKSLSRAHSTQNISQKGQISNFIESMPIIQQNEAFKVIFSEKLVSRSLMVKFRLLLKVNE